ncbi:MAG: hypothetical protein CMQ45_10245 [Gammaproteobacteria bacterium]|nr:hypothetical protein [Gammaproteobacteria bacterium]
MTEVKYNLQKADSEPCMSLIHGALIGNGADTLGRRRGEGINSAAVLQDISCALQLKNIASVSNCRIDRIVYFRMDEWSEHQIAR